MSLSSLYGFVVFKCKIDPNYFFDEMQPSEVIALSEAYFEEYKDRWERTRHLMHIMVSVNSSKPVKPTDVIEFAWDKDEADKTTSKVTEEDRERFRKKLNRK